MANGITFSLDDTRVKMRLSKMHKGVKSFKKPFNSSGTELLQFFGDEVFATQGSAVGESWRTLALSTLQARADRRGHYAKQPVATNKILVWTGTLQKGFKKQVTAQMLRIYNTVRYFKYHQQRGGSPPQRRMLAINREVITKVMRHVRRYVSSLVN